MSATRGFLTHCFLFLKLIAMPWQPDEWNHGKNYLYALMQIPKMVFLLSFTGKEMSWRYFIHPSLPFVMISNLILNGKTFRQCEMWETDRELVDNHCLFVNTDSCLKINNTYILMKTLYTSRPLRMSLTPDISTGQNNGYTCQKK